eukprot:232391-Rhodomonas_salina.1
MARNVAAPMVLFIALAAVLAVAYAQEQVIERFPPKLSLRLLVREDFSGLIRAEFQLDSFGVWADAA